MAINKKEAPEVSKSWFCVQNNPEEYGFTGTEEEITKQLIALWISGEETEKGEKRSIAANFCVSAEGLRHIHFVAESNKAMRFSKVKGVFQHAHLEPTQGNKKQVEDYINKKGVFAEKGEIILYKEAYGEVNGSQGKRNDLVLIDALLSEGKTPSEIFEELGTSSRRYEAIVKSAYFAQRVKETPRFRKVDVIWHVGVSGSGKSNCYKTDPRPDDMIFFRNAETIGTRGGFDEYEGEKVLFIDELKGGHIKYSMLLTICDGYKTPISCRYKNGYQLWDEVHITSVFTVDEMYKNMVKDEDKRIDSMAQIKGRISKTVFHYVLDCHNLAVVVEPRERQRTDPESLLYRSVSADGFASREELERLMNEDIEKLRKEMFPDLFDFMEEEKAEDFAQTFDF